MDTILNIISPVILGLLTTESSLHASPGSQRHDPWSSSRYSRRRSMVMSIFLASPKPLSSRDIRNLLPEALAAYARTYIVLSNPQATSSWICRNSVHGKSFMEVPDDVLRHMTGANEELLQDLLKVQMTIRGAYKKSARPPPSLREMFDRISETPPLTSHESSLDGLADSTSLWDFDGLDSSPQSDDNAPGNARPSNDDNLASTLGQTNTNTLPPSVGDITNDLGSGYRRLTTNTTPPSSPLPSLTVPPVIHPLIVPPSETNRNGIRGRIWVGTRRFARKIVENLRMLYQEAEVSACVSVGPW